MKTILLVPIFTIIVLSILGCTSVRKKSLLINDGDTKEQVIAVMGSPYDRQFRGKDEAWQYGQTGAGFGYNEHRVVWFHDGRVIGVTSYRSSGTTAGGGMREINWEERPDSTIEIRRR